METKEQLLGEVEIAFRAGRWTVQYSPEVFETSRLGLIVYKTCVFCGAVYGLSHIDNDGQRIDRLRNEALWWWYSISVISEALPE